MVKNKKKVLLSIGILLGIIGTISISYAAWIITREQTGMNQIKSTCFSISLENEKNEINLQNSFPILNEEGKKLTPYSFTITNTCDLFASYKVTLEMLDGSDMPTKYIASMINNEAIEILGNRGYSTPTISGATEGRVLASGSLGSGDSEDYTLRLWMDEGVTLADKDSMNKTLKAKVVIIASPSTYSPVENGITTLHDAILANEYQTSVEIAKAKIHNKQTPDFSKTAPLIDWQESHETNLVTTTATMPHPDKVGEYDGFTDITQSYIRMSNSYMFDKETGYYTLVDSFNVDPTTITDYSIKDYYFIAGSTGISNTDSIAVDQGTRSTVLYKIFSATKENTTQTGISGTVFEMVKYTLKGYLYNQVEQESDKSEKGLYEASDDYGTSYYYRGSVKNNNVKFGDVYYQIIRVNGDGSIRLLYNGTTPNATGNAKQIGTSAFNSNKNHLGYVGYKYGNVSGTTVEEIYANENDSTIKTALDSWYKTNIVDKNLSSYLADSGFCNDRSITSGDGTSTTTTTFYGPYQRYYQTKSPSLICPNKERDLFTTSTSSIGNKALQYPVGLITVDEVGLSGIAYGYLNRLAYVYSTNTFWTFSSSRFYVPTSSAHVFDVASMGYAEGTNVGNGYGVRPVINLSPDVEISGGIGTSSDPFIIKVAE